MNTKATFILIFGIGAAMGSIATWQCVKKKYEQIAQEEINSVKEVFSKREVGKQLAKDFKAGFEGVAVHAAKLQQKSSSNYTIPNVDITLVEEKERAMDKPYVIAPDEFGEYDDYEKISLTYYADQVLTDEDDEVIDDVDEIVGADSLTRFGEYEEDSVFVRNDKLRCDYEILLDQRGYSDAIQTRQY